MNFTVQEWVDTALILTTVDERNTSLPGSVTNEVEAENDEKDRVLESENEVVQEAIVMMTTDGAGSKIKTDTIVF